MRQRSPRGNGTGTFVLNRFGRQASISRPEVGGPSEGRSFFRARSPTRDEEEALGSEAARPRHEEVDDEREQPTTRPTLPSLVSGGQPEARSREALSETDDRGVATSGDDEVEEVTPPPNLGVVGTPPRDEAVRRATGAVVCIANQKGGVGKTTTAISLAAALAQSGVDVLLVDLDPQGNATTGLGFRVDKGDPSTYAVLIDGMAIEDASRATEVAGLDLLPSGLDLAGAEIELVPLFARESRLLKALERVRDRYQVVILDCPPTLGLLTVNALVAADLVLLPIQCEYYALEGVGQLMHTLDLVRSNLNESLRLGGVVLTMHDGRTRLSQQVVEEVRRHFGDQVFRTVIPRSVRLSEAPSFGEPITTFAPASRGARAYLRLADEFAERLGLRLRPVSPLGRLSGYEETVVPIAKGETFRDREPRSTPPPRSPDSQEVADQRFAAARDVPADGGGRAERSDSGRMDRSPPPGTGAGSEAQDDD